MGVETRGGQDLCDNNKTDEIGCFLIFCNSNVRLYYGRHHNWKQTAKRRSISRGKAQ